MTKIDVYNAAMATANAASARRLLASKAYRAREIGDAEFLAIVAEANAAHAAADKAESDLIADKAVR